VKQFLDADQGLAAVTPARENVVKGEWIPGRAPKQTPVKAEAEAEVSTKIKKRKLVPRTSPGDS
jgi:hypothetical protein